MNETPLVTWHAALHHCQQNGLPHVLATQVGALGSTPREPGARMVITPSSVIDTLGGGTFEWQTIDTARRHLAEGNAGFHLEAFSLGGRSGQCCGGFVNVMLEVFPGARTHLAVFGAGHVGQAIVALSHPLPWHRHWFDSRPESFASLEPAPRLATHRLNDPAAAVRSLPSSCHALVLTHSHDEDYALVDALCERDDLGSIGLIGSQSKWSSFKRRLQRAGKSEAALRRMRCPIGTLGQGKLQDKTPYAIGLCTVAELLTLTDAPASIDDHRGLESAALKPLFDDFQELDLP